MLILAAIAGIVAGYVATVYAELIIHRDIFHGHWAIVHKGPFKWLLYPNYVQHWKGHHTHAARHRDDLEQGDYIPESSHEKLATKYDSQRSVQHALRCTRHGITIRGLECFTHFSLLFFFTPQPYVAALLWFTLGPVAGIPAALMPVVTMIMFRYHRYYHMSFEARKRNAPRWQHWFVLSAEFARLTDEHLKHHHDSRFSSDYYVLLPFGNRILHLFGKKSNSKGISNKRPTRKSLKPHPSSDRNRREQTAGPR